MKPRVHILATCNNPELEDAALLVFKTLRVGFPTAEIAVWLNGPLCERQRITDAAMKCDCDIKESEPTIHHDWIRNRLSDEVLPFWICDTDVIFRQPVEHWTTDQPLMGSYSPEFDDKWTKCRTEPRLHTSLLWFNLPAIQTRLNEFRNSVRVSRFSPLVDLVSPALIPPNQFYDTCALLYKAVGGAKFTAEQLGAYEHLHGATWVNELESTYPGITAQHREIYADNSKAAGSHAVMQRFYQGRSGNTLNEFCVEVCKGQPDAIEFCATWFHYCHLIDDLVDAAERPGAEMLMEAFAMANALYTSRFYMAHSAFLHPSVMSITNAYADSVNWEKSDVHRRKTIADVLRCCGNEMFFAVAYVCGGWKHQRSVSSRIRERSWELQHDQNDQPD